MYVYVLPYIVRRTMAIGYCTPYNVRCTIHVIFKRTPWHIIALHKRLAQSTLQGIWYSLGNSEEEGEGEEEEEEEEGEEEEEEWLFL